MKGVYMLVVTKIETFETPLNTAQIERMIYDQNPYAEYLPIDGQPVNVKVLKEVIRGRRFRHPKRGIDTPKTEVTIIDLITDVFKAVAIPPKYLK